MYIIFFVIILFLIYVFITYNKFVSRKNKIKQAASGIEVYLTQRFDLIPNLVECVKSYMEFETNTFTEITKLRTNYMQNKNLKDGEILNNKFNKIITMTENYPELKTSENFLNLQRNLQKTESQLQAARRLYNIEVNVYNNLVKMFPSNILADFFGFKEDQFFQADEEAKTNINLNM